MSEHSVEQPEVERRFSILHGRRSAQRAAARVFDELVRERALGGTSTAEVGQQNDDTQELDVED